MGKVQVTLDASKLRNLISKRSYKNKDGQEVELQEVKFELVEVKEPKQIYEKDNMKIMKTHFASAIQTKEEREAKSDTIYIGEGFTTVWSNNETVSHVATPIKEVEDDDSDLPF
jgi:hypothetical protein